MSAEPGELLDIARRAVALGAGLLAGSTPEQIEQKSDRDFVTAVDRRIQNALRDFLATATPGIEFLGEEVGGPDADPETADAVWILDPIDGTSNFIHGLPLSAVSLALAQRGTPTIGVVSAPFLGLEYYATAGGGAYCNGLPIRASTTTALRDAIVSLGDYATGAAATEKNVRRIALTAALAASVERVRMFGSAALDLAWVAEGRTDACVINSNKPWDTGAGVLIAREAGATVTDFCGVAHTFASADTVAATSGVSRELLKLIAAAVEASG
ncbi:inositol monophosphatase family protein [Nocardia sp. NPDC005978]|uniref:inositol monophosphatase family protein n=1 Tax=Nocardia sp. NPDC005978 TaxID=3156725 RepID=UPI0033A4BE00